MQSLLVAETVTCKVQVVEHSGFGCARGRGLVNKVLVQDQSCSSSDTSALGAAGEVPLHWEMLSEFGRSQTLCNSGLTLQCP